MNKDERAKCNDCHDFLENGEMVHSIQYGFWQSDSNEFENNGQEEHYCRECWSDRSPMREGIEMEVNSPEELIETLESSNGKLVADFNSQIVGSRVFMRVIGQRAEFAYVKARRIGDDTIGFNPEFEEKSREESVEFTEEVLTSGDLPPVIVLTNAEKTPFNNYPDLEETQSSIDKFQG